MLKKQFSLIFLATVFLLFDNQTKAMQESNVASTLEATIQQDVLNCQHDICRILSTVEPETLKSVQQICPSLQSLAATKLLKTLKDHGVNLDSLGANVISEDLKIYCKQCPLIPLIPSINLIHKHIAFLEKKFKKYGHPNITNENLCLYNTLLHQLICDIDLRDISMEKVLGPIESIFFDAFITVATITLEDINLILKLLMHQKDRNFSKEELIWLNKIWHYICKGSLSELLKLLAKNKNLLPQLDYIIGVPQFVTFFDRGKTFFMFLVDCHIDINLFKSIINEERNKDYNWERLFSFADDRQRTILHYAVSSFSKDILEVILELMKEKKLKLNGLINNENYFRETPLMIAAEHGDDEIVHLLINSGADINILSTVRNKTALDYATERRKKLMTSYSIDYERLEKVNRCIELLTPKTICLLQ